MTMSSPRPGMDETEGSVYRMALWKWLTVDSKGKWDQYLQHASRVQVSSHAKFQLWVITAGSSGGYSTGDTHGQKAHLVKSFY